MLSFWLAGLQFMFALSLFVLQLIFYVCCALALHHVEGLATGLFPPSDWLKAQGHMTIEAVLLILTIRWRWLWAIYAIICTALYRSWAPAATDAYGIVIHLQLIVLLAWIFLWHYRNIRHFTTTTTHS